MKSDTQPSMRGPQNSRHFAACCWDLSRVAHTNKPVVCFVSLCLFIFQLVASLQSQESVYTLSMDVSLLWCRRLLPFLQRSTG